MLRHSHGVRSCVFVLSWRQIFLQQNVLCKNSPFSTFVSWRRLCFDWFIDCFISDHNLQGLRMCRNT